MARDSLTPSCVIISDVPVLLKEFNLSALGRTYFLVKSR